MKIIGLDVGTKRIGVARADSTTRIAVPSGFITVDGTEWDEISRLAKLYSTNWFVLGLPRSNEGNETQQSQYVRSFAKELLKRIPDAKIRFQDESLTSVVAEDRLKARKKTYEKGEIDSEAAAIILQDFLETFNKNDVKVEEVKEETNIIKNNIDTVKEVARKESDKVKMSAKKTKHKIKKWPIFLVLLVIVAGCVGGFFVVQKIRERNAEERRKEYARIEAEMKAEVFDFTVKPGETIFDIKKHLVEAGYSIEEVNKAFDAEYDFAFLKGRPAGATLEGYLYGETYEFYKGVPVEDIVTKYLEKMGEVIAENNLEARYAAHGLSLFEGITLASVVQKESPAGEHATVAQVFMTRLAYGIPMGSDVTVTYALNVVDPDRTTYKDNQAALKIDSCYNTRLHGGLPCGPISNPSLASLLAVADPADSSYLYFLTGDDGLMYYSYTEAEHNQNAYLHCQNLCNISL
ncbi:endolytic transglycosylase MltG [Candidatus Saccharibacteria bacterium]|nr:endolytic transglycosylase MltG [Candidatus Saccharibacteria bacterium]